MLERLRAVTRLRHDTELRRELAGRVHPVGGEHGGVFVRDPVALVTCDAHARAAFEDFLDGAPREAACRRHNVTGDQFDALIEVLRGVRPRVPDAAPVLATAIAPESAASPGSLDRLVLNISNDCNLRCAYCYADGGAYGGSRGLMSRDTALRAVDVFLAAFTRVNRIQFFGGEPLLNLDVVASVAREIENRRSAGTLPQPPSLGVVTNGTLDPDALVDLCRRFGLGVTVSVDGPPEIHDQLRGSGTFDKIRAFTSKLASERIEFGIEGTYTARHVAARIHLVDLLAFYRREFGLVEVHVPWCSRPAGDPLMPGGEVLEAEYRAAIACSLDPATRDGIASLGFATRLLDAVTKREAIESYCQAGLGTFAVDPAGDIYPCFMFVGERRFVLGNIRTGADGNAPASDIFSRLLAGKTGPACEACWARPLCFGCVGADFVVHGDSFDKSACSIVRAMADEGLRRVMMAAGNGRRAVDVDAQVGVESSSDGS